MTKFWALVRAEPVRLVAAVQSTLAVLVVFGVPLTEAQLAAVVLAIGAWLGFVTRQQVTHTHTMRGDALPDGP